MLEAARRKIAAENVSFLQHDIRRPWPVAAAACDQVICALVLEHIEELAPPFAHAAKALRRGGRLFVCEYHPAKQLLGKKANFVDPSTGVVVDFPAYLHDIADYVAAARQAGLTLDDLTEWRDPGAAKTDVPRLVSLEFVRPKPPPAE
jgi:malonyl-CoA O-methyltransferase